MAYEVPAQPGALHPWRFAHDVVWACDDDNVAEAAKSIEASDTDCHDYITYDSTRHTRTANSSATDQS